MTNQSIDTLRALFQFARPYKRRFLVIALLSILATGADLVHPLIYRVAINDVAGLFTEQHSSEDLDMPTGSQLGSFEDYQEPKQPHRSNFVAPRTKEQTLKTLLEAAAALFLISMLGHLFSLLADYQTTHAASRIEARIIQNTFGHVLRLPLSFFSKRSSGGLAKRIDQSDQAAPIVSAFAQQIAPEGLRIVGICAIMFTQNWRLTAVALCMLPLYLWVAVRAARRLDSGMSEYYELWEGVSARIQDALASIKTVKLSGAEPREVARLAKTANYAYNDYLARTRVGSRFLFLQSTITYASKALILGYGGYLVSQNRTTPGDVVMFAVYLDQLFGPIDALSSTAVQLQQHIASLSRAVRLLQTGKEEAIGEAVGDGPGMVEFRDVRFSYSPAREVLRGLNLTLEAGKVTALVGPSGAGKTTVADLLLKLWEPSEGAIFIDGRALAKTDPSAIRGAVGVVAADGALFRDTLAGNIRYKRPEATDDEVLRAAEAAGLKETIERLPLGLETEIGERGVGLSVGERQRLQMARILVDRPRVLVLDEATANLDYATETGVKQALNLMQPRPTTLLIAHRYSMVKDADYVYVLQDGRVAEQGRPADLVAQDGWFAKLARQSPTGTA